MMSPALKRISFVENTDMSTIDKVPETYYGEDSLVNS